MWASVDILNNNEVTQVYTRPTAITYGEVNYPANVMSSWTDLELTTIGVYPVVEDKTNLENSYYYINTNETFTFKATYTYDGVDYTNTVIGSWGTATPKNLNDTTNDDGVVTQGLKSQQINIANSTAYSELLPSDWYVVRKADNGTAIPTNWDNWRQSVRTTCETYITNVNACTSVPELEALGETPTYPPSPST